MKLNIAMAKIETFYHLIKNNFEIIAHVNKCTWSENWHNKAENEIEERQRVDFIASEKWKIKEYLSEIKKINEEIKKLIHV